MSEEKPSYYAIITADVRYDKRLRPNEKLLFGEITCLTNKLGYCYSTNNYFAELYGVTPQAVSRWVSNLEKCGYIKCGYLHNGTEVKERRIFLTNQPKVEKVEDTNSQNCYLGINKKLKGYKQKVKENITSGNITSDNTTSIKGKKPEGEHKQVYEHYQKNYDTLFNQGKLQTNKVKIDYGKCGKLLKDIFKTYKLEDLINVLDRGMNDDWIVSGGYNLSIMLSANQLNKLLNGKPQNQTSQKNNFNKSDLDDKISLGEVGSWK